jgi:putative nucleotidyltransferase with HDIG domain
MGRYIKIAPTNPANLYLSPNEILGRNVRDVLPKEQADQIVAKIRASLESGEVISSEYALQVGGKEIWFEANISPLSDDTAIWVEHNITNRKQAAEVVRERLSELEVLYASSQAIGQSLRPKEIGQKIIDILSERLHWHHITIRQYHPESGTLELLAFQQVGMEKEADWLATEERFRTMIARPGQGFTGWVVQHGQPIYCSDVTKDPRYIEVEPGIRSGMYVPLKVGEHTIGCLSVESEQFDAFTETDEWLITTLAAQAARALENARLFEETQRRLRQTMSLREIDQAIAGSMNLHLVLEIVLKHIITELGVDAAVILLYNPQEQVLKYELGKGLQTNALHFTRLRLGDGYAGQAALAGKTIHISNLQTGKTDFLRSPTFSLERFICYYGIPLITKGEIKGVLEIFHRSLINPDTEWLDFMETLAGQIAIAIDNATLYKDLQLSNIELALAYDATIEGWSRALDLRDKETEGHTQRVTRITIELAQAMGIGEVELVNIRRGALLHDIGKMGVPDNILLKPDKLTDEEWVIMRKHPTYAYEMLLPITYLKSALDIPYCHHEKWDGTGYPRGLQSEQIPLVARIFAIVDMWDALCSDRPYRKGWPEEKAIEYIKAGSGTHFDPKVVDMFFRMTSDGSLLT